MKPRNTPPFLIYFASLLFPLSLPAQAEPSSLSLTPAPQNTELGQKILADIPSPFNEGRLLYNARFRYEHANQEELRSSNAFTLRQRFGYETPRFNGFYGLAEGEYNWVLNNNGFGAFPLPFNDGRTVIPDPESWALNRLFAGYESDEMSLKGGRQEINLGNQRFIGTVGWRQNNQTYDAVRLETSVIPNLDLNYAWNWQVNRIFGSKAPTTPLRRLKTDNHIFNAIYRGLPDATVGAYLYSLRLRNLQALSSDTYGLYIDSRRPLGDHYSLLYRAEYAYQTDNSNTTGPGYGENYLHFRLGAAREGYQVGVGFESLGGSGKRAFQTPLATLHAFNGWTDTFLTTPPDGLRDYYLWLSGPVFAEINGRFESHFFTGENTRDTYGHEFGLSLSRKLTENLSAMLKGAYYSGRSSSLPAINADKTKIWLQLDFLL